MSSLKVLQEHKRQLSDMENVVKKIQFNGDTSPNMRLFGL